MTPSPRRRFRPADLFLVAPALAWTVAACGALSPGHLGRPLHPDPAAHQLTATGAFDAPPALTQAPRDPGHLTVVLLGDTGEPAPFQARLRAAIAAETSKDAVVVLGDLVYPEAPPCPTGAPDAAADALLAERLGAIVGGLGAPTYLLVGNHDVDPLPVPAPRSRCLSAWVAAHPEHGLAMPATAYTVDFGHALLAVIDTNALDDRQGAFVRAAFDAHPGVKLLAGHHTLKTYHDKQRQDLVRPWLARHGLRPDVYLNGHAHLLQLGRYDGLLAVTSGTGATPRDAPACPPTCGPDQHFGSSVPGYAVLHVTRDALEIVFKDADGAPLHRLHGDLPR